MRFVSETCIYARIRPPCPVAQVRKPMIVPILLFGFLALVAFSLALKGLLQGRLPITKTVNIEGIAARIVGAICLLFGIFGCLAVFALIIEPAIERQKREQANLQSLQIDAEAKAERADQLRRAQDLDKVKEAASDSHSNPHFFLKELQKDLPEKTAAEYYRSAVQAEEGGKVDDVEFQNGRKEAAGRYYKPTTPK